MIKKHLITCSVILVTLFISGLFIYAKTDTKKVAKGAADYKFIYPKNDVNSVFSFADEAIPVHDLRISRKLRKSLAKTSYNHVQSNILQEEAVKIFPIVVPILKHYGIPEDFKYMPLVEAGLKSGVSKRGAAGWWQFMPGTARNYGLKVGNDRDDRYSVRRSTVAACKYLKELYAQFNSWTLAAAAYNIGEIKMAKAIKAQSEDNYFRMHFNPETGVYIYRIIAMKQVIEQPELYGYKGIYKAITLPPVDLMALN